MTTASAFHEKHSLQTISFTFLFGVNRMGGIDFPIAQIAAHGKESPTPHTDTHVQRLP